MKSFFLIYVICLGALSAKETLHLGDVPPSHNGAIYDPDQWLTADSRSEMARNISMAKSKWQAQIYVIVLSNPPEIEEAVLAKKIAEKWGGGLWGVVMHVVGDSNAPMFFAGRKEPLGWSEKQEDDFFQSIEGAVEDVRGRALREADQRLQVETGTRELCDELGYLGLVMARIDNRYDSARGRNLQVVREKRSNQSFVHKIAIVLGLLVCLVVALIWIVVRKRRRETRSDFYFPETSPRRRFLAPWSGGSDVIVNVGSRLRKDGSRKG